MKLTVLLATLSLLSTAYGYEAQIKKAQMNASLEAMLEKATRDTGVAFDTENMTLIEDRELATSHYSFYVQTSEMIPVDGTAIRIWKDKRTGELILAELNLDEKHQSNRAAISAKFRKAKFSKSALKSNQLSKAVQKIVETQVGKHDTDAKILGFKSADKWVNGDLVRQVEVRGRRGTRFISFSLLRNVVIEKSYQEFPQSETVSIKANVFPMYEEVETTHEILPYEVRELKHIHATRADGGKDPLAGLNGRRFKEDTYYPILAGTAIGDAYGLWSFSSILKTVRGLQERMPVVANDLVNGMLLQGKYATVQIHPDAKKAFEGINFEMKPSVNPMVAVEKQKDETGAEAYYGVPVPGLLGKPITSEVELTTRIPFRMPKHDPTTYINQGFDEQQVYYAVTTLMESLAGMGFTDKELSERPFHAFLFDPDLGMKDNAYYTNDTINFTTYNPDMPNLARDNPTIWHELGHGVMDRLMGEHLAFGDSKGGYGGLSEGMADFIAKLVVEEQTAGADFPGKFDFRIMNNTGFYLTNEYHDEGEAYGGAMNDMLDVVVAQKGKAGLVAFTDLTLEAMRLTRNHPSLTARKWYEHMIIADELGSDVRASGEFTAIIEQALAKRNFAFDSLFKPAVMKVTSKLGELDAASAASREKPTQACDASGTFSYDLDVKLSAGDSEFIKFPATVKVEFKKGALQGAIAWAGEETNPLVYTVNSAEETLKIALKGSMTCENINQPDGSCKDYAYLQVFNEGAEKPVAKKRFYVKIDPKVTCKK
jgi:hypothetical protein